MAFPFSVEGSVELPGPTEGEPELERLAAAIRAQYDHVQITEGRILAWHGRKSWRNTFSIKRPMYIFPPYNRNYLTLPVFEDADLKLRKAADAFSIEFSLGTSLALLAALLNSAVIGLCLLLLGCPDWFALPFLLLGPVLNNAILRRDAADWLRRRMNGEPLAQ